MEGHAALVFCRDDRRDGRFAVELPVDTQRRIIPRHRAFVLGRIKVGGLVENMGGLGYDSEAVSKSAWNP